jgi:hypothetical protein
MAGWNRVDKNKHEYHPDRAVFSNPVESSWLVAAGVADLFEGAFDELFSLLPDVVIDGGHRLNRAGRGTGEGELAVGDLALVQSERTIAEDDEAAIGEMAGFVFVEIEDDFFIVKGVFADFHG